MDHETAGTLSEQVIEAIGEAVIADRQFLRTTLTGILARGHVLLEDVPGTGKTLTARTFATALDLSFQRIQFTPDLLPADITGSNIYNDATGEFEFSRGPIFANVVLADEINRAPPKTQAALLEAMGEKQVTVDGVTYDLPEPFFVIATQNPVEQEGTFGLPEAQRDRFMIKTSLGYPEAEGERLLLDRRAGRIERTPSIEPVIDAAQVSELQQVPEHTEVDPRLRDYIIELGRWTRFDDRVEVGISPRGIQRLFEASRARAVVAGREYVVPDDIKEMAVPVFAHRLVLGADASVREISPTDIVEDALGNVPVPAVDDDQPEPAHAAANGSGQHSEPNSADGHSPGADRSAHADDG
ncbi:AAA domain-containing protein [Halovenus sp. WSH3]|uniref:AAA domain-containing protein n=1 Tax=Halovenus carboxidivorans TaxID=2692199 RepID=A0A6B0SZT3_9EURY|nr:MoxR family ATPase [Halovenus carboxidivorans]MXR51045.1 AAA domain-containing protein [Halovenus carboxidivorans]